MCLIDWWLYLYVPHHRIWRPHIYGEQDGVLKYDAKAISTVSATAESRPIEPCGIFLAPPYRQRFQRCYFPVFALTIRRGAIRRWIERRSVASSSNRVPSPRQRTYITRAGAHDTTRPEDARGGALNRARTRTRSHRARSFASPHPSSRADAWRDEQPPRHQG